MNLRHALNWPYPLRLKVALIASIMAALLAVGMGFIEVRLKQQFPHMSMLDLQWDKTTLSARMFVQLKEQVRDLAVPSLLLDFPMIICYCTLLAMIASAVARRGFRDWGMPRGFLQFMPWLALPAGLADYVENGSLLYGLYGGTGDWWPDTFWYAVRIKFGCLILLIGFIAAGLLTWFTDSDPGEKAD